VSRSPFHATARPPASSAAAAIDPTGRTPAIGRFPLQQQADAIRSSRPDTLSVFIFALLSHSRFPFCPLFCGPQDVEGYSERQECHQGLFKRPGEGARRCVAVRSSTRGRPSGRGAPRSSDSDLANGCLEPKRQVMIHGVQPGRR